MIGRSSSQRYFSRRVRRVSLGRPNTLFGRFEISSFQSSNRCAHLYGSHRTLRHGLFVGACSRHFVPGYDRTVPPGRFATRFLLNFWVQTFSIKPLVSRGTPEQRSKTPHRCDIRRRCRTDDHKKELRQVF